MIVSEIEIRKVIELRTPRRPEEHPAPAQIVTCAVPADQRHLRVLDIRNLLNRGEYRITPLVVAEKMVGRAICDQVARLYDA